MDVAQGSEMAHGSFSTPPCMEGAEAEAEDDRKDAGDVAHSTGGFVAIPVAGDSDASADVERSNKRNRSASFHDEDTFTEANATPQRHNDCLASNQSPSADMDVAQGSKVAQGSSGAFPLMCTPMVAHSSGDLVAIPVA